jgi:hypothetical protein
MIKNYLLIAFRNVLRYKGFSLINILGLSLSMSVCEWDPFPRQVNTGHRSGPFPPWQRGSRREYLFRHQFHQLCLRSAGVDVSG